MAKAARQPSTVHSFANNRIERASNELDQLRKRIRELTAQKDQLNARVLTMLRNEGEADDEGKVRYETTMHTFCIIKGSNTYTDLKKLKVSLAAEGLTPKQIAKVLKPAVKVTEYEYPGVYLKKDAAEGEGEAEAAS